MDSWLSGFAPKLSVFAVRFDLWTPVGVCVQEAVDGLEPARWDTAEMKGHRLLSTHEWYNQGMKTLRSNKTNETGTLLKVERLEVLVNKLDSEHTVKGNPTGQQL